MNIQGMQIKWFWIILGSTHQAVYFNIFYSFSPVENKHNTVILGAVIANRQ